MAIYTQTLIMLFIRINSRLNSWLAYLNTKTAYILTYIMHPGKILQFFKTCSLTPLSVCLFNGRYRAYINALPAITTVPESSCIDSFGRIICLERHVCKDSCKSYFRAKLRMHKQVVPPYPADTSPQAIILCERCAVCFSQSIIWLAGIGRALYPLP